MDDIQFWLYIVFGLIYFVGRFFKKKKATQQEGQETGDVIVSERPQKAKTFEELLREFTDEQEEPEPSIRKEPIEESRPDTKLIQKAEVKKERPFIEGTTRHFSDDESKRIYEESVKRAEGFELEFEPNLNFKTNLQRNESNEVTSKFASEIRAGLSDPEEAKKALIYAEIFNRKY